MVFVGEPTPEDYAAIEAEARAAARDAGVVEAVRDGVSIARLVAAGDADNAAVIADRYVLTLADLAPQLDGIDALAHDAAQLLAAGYALANRCNAGDHPAAHALAARYGTTVDAVLERLADV